MSLGHGDVGGFTNDQPAVVQVWMHINQFQQFFIIIKGCVSASLFQITHKGRTVDWSEHLMVAPNRHISRRIARDLRELRGRFGDQFADPLRIRPN